MACTCSEYLYKNINCSTQVRKAIPYLVVEELSPCIPWLPEVMWECLTSLPRVQVRECQVLLFSATVPSWVNNIAKKYTDNPLTVDAVGTNVSILLTTDVERGADESPFSFNVW